MDRQAEREEPGPAGQVSQNPAKLSAKPFVPPLGRIFSSSLLRLCPLSGLAKALLLGLWRSSSDAPCGGWGYFTRSELRRSCPRSTGAETKLPHCGLSPSSNLGLRSCAA